MTLRPMFTKPVAHSVLLYGETRIVCASEPNTAVMRVIRHQPHCFVQMREKFQMVKSHQRYACFVIVNTMLE